MFGICDKSGIKKIDIVRSAAAALKEKLLVKKRLISIMQLSLQKHYILPLGIVILKHYLTRASHVVS